MRKAIICFLEKGDEILLLYTDYGNKKVWNGISGYIENEEEDTEAAIREIKEEVGIEANPEDLITEGVHDIFTIFVLKKWTGVPKSKESSIKELKWFNKNNLPYSEMHEGNKEWLPTILIKDKLH